MQTKKNYMDTRPYDRLITLGKVRKAVPEKFKVIYFKNAILPIPLFFCGKGTG